MPVDPSVLFSTPPPRKVAVPIIDVHTHVRRLPETRLLVEAAQHYGVARLVGIATLDDCLSLKEEYPDALVMAATLVYDNRHDPERFVRENLALLERGAAAGLKVVKLWFKPSFNVETGMKLDDPRLAPIFARMGELGLVALIHIADPDIWWVKYYSDRTVYETKEETYRQAENVLARYPALKIILAHLGGDPEHLDHLEQLLSSYPNLYLDTSATKWLVRELGKQREAARDFFIRWRERLLFGTDLVVRPGLPLDHYLSRYWVHQLFWETDVVCPSPIPDPDCEGTPMIRGLDLPADVLHSLYHDNAVRVLG
ncbi:MAG: amidohydrolase [Limnochordales bacterium]|nr:amidohydrolase [Limnochordales bacterium]